MTLFALSDQPVIADETGAQTQPADNSQVGFRLRERRLVDAARSVINPLLPEGADDEFRKIRTKYSQVLSNGTNPTNASEMGLVREGLTYRVYRLTMPEVINSPTLQSEAVQQLWTDLAGVGKRIANPDDKRRWRDTVNAEVLTLLKTLLKNNMTSRSLAITRIGQLHSVYGTRQEDLKYYPGSYPVLLEVLQDAEQPEAIRVQAALQLGEFVGDENPEPPVQMEIAARMVEQLDRKDTHEIYQIGLIMALWNVASPREVINNRDPIVISVMADILSDYQNRSLLVRSFAASGLSRAGIDGRINIEPLALKTLELAGELALFANNDWKPQYELAARNIFVAFRTPETDHGPGSPNPHGFLNRAPNSEVVTTSAKLTLDLMTELLLSRKASNASFNSAAMFLMEHIGDDMKFDPRLPALPAVLSRGGAAPTPPAGASTDGTTPGEPPEGE